MQKELLKLAITGMAAGLCLSAQSNGEIAMSKCTRAPSAPQQENNNNQMMQEDDSDMDDTSSCGSQSCANSCGSQGDQSSQNEQRSTTSKRLSAAKTAMGNETMPKAGTSTNQ